MTDIALVGEAWGESEAKLRLPFVGPAGYELNGQLEDAGINRRDCFITNVFNLKPEPTNDIKNLCCPKKDDTLGWRPISAGNYLRPAYAPELDRLHHELSEYKPNIVVALGGTALWALTGRGGISGSRGALSYTDFIGPRRDPILKLKVLPTFHPSWVMQYSPKSRPIAIADLMKAKRQSAFPEIRHPQRFIHVAESHQDIMDFYAEHIRGATYLAFDIETAAGLITCVGFAPSMDRSLVIPFRDDSRGGNYWPTSDYERQAWDDVRAILGADVPKVAQNGLYDLHWLWRECGITVNNVMHDTMLLHHALHPEAQKGLGFLGSLYADVPAWKTAFKDKTAKKEA
jgi:uracil-DNA glycosylase